MSFFGSREEDPLLQDELFSPASNEDASEGGETSETDGQGSERRYQPDGRTRDTRRIECSQEDAAAGRLDQLNRALRDNWELVRIQLVDQEQFTFTLRKTYKAGPTSDSIV